MKQRERSTTIDHRADERLEGGRVRGWILRAHLAWVREYGNDRELRELWSEVDADAAGVLSLGFDADAWYPFRWLISLDRAIYRCFANGVDESALMEDLGRFAARMNLSSRFRQWPNEDHHRFFVELTSLHREFQDFGTATYRRYGESRGQIFHAGYICFSRAYCASAVGYYEQCLLLHGAIRGTVTEQTCQCLGWPSCKFELKWR